MSTADGDNGEATPDEFHETSNSLALVAHVSARARDQSTDIVHVTSLLESTRVLSPLQAHVFWHSWKHMCVVNRNFVYTP